MKKKTNRILISVVGFLTAVVIAGCQYIPCPWWAGNCENDNDTTTEEIVDTGDEEEEEEEDCVTAGNCEYSQEGLIEPVFEYNPDDEVVGAYVDGCHAIFNYANGSKKKVYWAEASSDAGNKGDWEKIDPQGDVVETGNNVDGDTTVSHLDDYLTLKFPNNIGTTNLGSFDVAKIGADHTITDFLYNYNVMGRSTCLVHTEPEPEVDCAEDNTCSYSEEGPIEPVWSYDPAGAAVEGAYIDGCHAILNYANGSKKKVYWPEESDGTYTKGDWEKLDPQGEVFETGNDFHEDTTVSHLSSTLTTAFPGNAGTTGNGPFDVAKIGEEHTITDFLYNYNVMGKSTCTVHTEPEPYVCASGDYSEVGPIEPTWFYNGAEPPEGAYLSGCHAIFNYANGSKKRIYWPEVASNGYSKGDTEKIDPCNTVVGTGNLSATQEVVEGYIEEGYIQDRYAEQIDAEGTVIEKDTTDDTPTVFILDGLLSEAFPGNFGTTNGMFYDTDNVTQFAPLRKINHPDQDDPLFFFRTHYMMGGSTCGAYDK